MKLLIKSFSYIFHPLLMPLLGALIYFDITPKFVPKPFMYAKLMAIVILTIFVPIMFYYLLRNLGMVDSIALPDVKQRRIPLFFQVVFTIIIVELIVNGYEFPELYFFFIGILITATVSFVLALAKYKMSLHMAGLSGLLFFVIGMSIHYTSNLLLLVAILFFALGAAATSRISEKAHSGYELLVGMALGLLPQVALFVFWL